MGRWQVESESHANVASRWSIRRSRASRASRTRSDDTSAPRKRASRSSPPLRRLFYWCAVLGLWALIVAGGAIV